MVSFGNTAKEQRGSVSCAGPQRRTKPNLRQKMQSDAARREYEYVWIDFSNELAPGASTFSSTNFTFMVAWGVCGLGSWDTQAFERRRFRFL
jgi:hypothetical protein